MENEGRRDDQGHNLEAPRGDEMMGETEALRQKLLERIADLSETRLQEVLDFVEFLRIRERKGEDPILNVAGCLSGSPLSAKEIEEELYGEDPA